jgi:DNA repair exonuclease SbcCD ATPase subunit
MKRYANSNSDITLLAYKNSSNFQKKDINNQRKQIKHILKNVHEVNYKQVVQTLKKENNELNQKLALVIEKDKEISKLTIELEKCKNIIAKYHIDEKREENKDKLYKQLHDKYQQSNDTIQQLSLQLHKQQEFKQEFKQEFEKLQEQYDIIYHKKEEYLNNIRQLSLKLHSKQEEIETINGLVGLLKQKLIEFMNQK